MKRQHNRLVVDLPLLHSARCDSIYDDALVLPSWPILNRLGHVRGLNALRAGQVGNPSCKFDASRVVESAGREVEPEPEMGRERLWKRERQGDDGRGEEGHEAADESQGGEEEARSDEAGHARIVSF